MATVAYFLACGLLAFLPNFAFFLVTTLILVWLISRGGMANEPYELKLPFYIAVATKSILVVGLMFWNPFPPNYFYDSAHYAKLGRYLYEVILMGGFSTEIATSFATTSRDHLVYGGIFLLFGAITQDFEVKGPLLAQSLNLVSFSLGVFLLAKVVAFYGSLRIALYFGIALAFIPSYAFWAGQNVRESIAFLGISGVLFALMHGATPISQRIGLFALMGVILYFYRTQGSWVFFGGIGVYILIQGLNLVSPKIRLVLWGGLVLLGWALLPFDHLPNLIQMARDRSQAAYLNFGEIASMLEPGIALSTWPDLLSNGPLLWVKSQFYPLFFVYESNGKLGLILSQIENTGLLLATISMVGYAVYSKKSVLLLPFLVYFAFSLVYSMVEPDLGSAGRHRMHYWPLLFLAFSSLFIAKGATNLKPGFFGRRVGILFKLQGVA